MIWHFTCSKVAEYGNLDREIAMIHGTRTQGKERRPCGESGAYTSPRTRSAVDRSKRLVEVGVNPLFALAVGLTSEEGCAGSKLIYSK